MKTPRLRPSSLRHSSRPYLSQISVNPVQPLTESGGALVGGVPTTEQQKDDLFIKFRKLWKYDEKDIAALRKLIDGISSVASGLTSLIAAYSTVKSLLELAGVLKADDSVAKGLAHIDEEVRTLIQFHTDDAIQREFTNRVGWQDPVSRVKAGLDDIERSRSQTTFDSLVRDHGSLMTAIREMLGFQQHDESPPGAPPDPSGGELVPMSGLVPFFRKQYGYQSTWPPAHWIDYASGWCMQTSGGRPVDYAAPSQELAARIWDPGYFLDVALDAVGIYLAALSALEPAFRSTGYRRKELEEIHGLLQVFAAKWERSFLMMRLDGEISMTPDSFGYHALYHPFAFLFPPFARTIALGVIDPVMGVSSFTPSWNEGFQTMNFGSQVLLANFDPVYETALEAQSILKEKVRQECGLPNLYPLIARFAALKSPPIGSDFVELSDATTHTWLLWYWPQLEKLSLGKIGEAAGKGGNLYTARRVAQQSSKTFRIPMVRRMDASGIQLGYRLSLRVGGSPQPLDIELCKYSSVGAPSLAGTMPLFPSEPKAFTLQTAATVYDVVQTDLFTPDEEDLFENTGAAPGKDRLYVDPRPGSATLDIKVEFQLDTLSPDHHFIGFADVTISNMRPEDRDGFIVGIQVFETNVSSNNMPIEQHADAMTLHFAPTFLLPEPAYFTDRVTGLAALVKVIAANAKYLVEIELPGKPNPEPSWKYEQIAYQNALVVRAFEAFALMEPDAARQSLAQFQVPKVHPARPT